jgi:hypothetical protein
MGENKDTVAKDIMIQEKKTEEICIKGCGLQMDKKYKPSRTTYTRLMLSPRGCDEPTGCPWA